MNHYILTKVLLPLGCIEVLLRKLFWSYSVLITIHLTTIANHARNIKIFIIVSIFQKPYDITSTHDALLIRFRSDDTLVNQGFSLMYEEVDPEGFSEEEEI